MHVWVLCRVKPRRLRGRRGFTQPPENSSRTFDGPRRPHRETKRAKMGAGEGTKSAKFWAPTLRGPTCGAPPFGAPLVLCLFWVRSCREFRRRGREVRSPDLRPHVQPAHGFGEENRGIGGRQRRRHGVLRPCRTAVGLQLHPLAAVKHYGGTCTQSGRRFKQIGWEVTFCGVEDFEGIQKALIPKTKALYCESMAIPGGLVVDPDRLADHVFLGPTLRIRLDVVHSTTEVLDGHGRSLNFNGLMEALCPQPNGCRSDAGAVSADRLPCEGEGPHPSLGQRLSGPRFGESGGGHAGNALFRVAGVRDVLVPVLRQEPESLPKAEAVLSQLKMVIRLMYSALRFTEPTCLGDEARLRFGKRS